MTNAEILSNAEYSDFDCPTCGNPLEIDDENDALYCAKCCLYYREYNGEIDRIG